MKDTIKYARIKDLEEKFAEKASEAKDFLYAINRQGILENMFFRKLLIQRKNLAKDFLKINDLGAEYLELTNGIKSNLDYNSYVACSRTIVRLLDTKIKKIEDGNIDKINRDDFGYLNHFGYLCQEN